MCSLLRLILVVFGSVSASFFEEGFDHHYTYSSESDILGLHNVTTVVKFRVRKINSTVDDGSFHLLIVDSFTQHTEKGYFADNPMKWDLDKEFLFTIGRDGLVTVVFYHPEDKHELLSIKKVLASVLSLKVIVQQEPEWRFISEELDHTGKLEHDYVAEKTPDGMKFVRSHRSSKEVLRHHTKILHMDHSGTPFRIESLDNVTLHSDTTEIKRTNVDGTAEILDEQSGDFPKISSVSRTKVELSAKRPHNDASFVQTTQLQQDSLVVKKKEEERVPLTVLEEDIGKQIKCIHLYFNKFERNRTECVNKLGQLLLSLHQADFLNLGKDMLTRECEGNMTMCLEERNLFIDMLAMEGSHEAQKLLVDNVFYHNNVTEEETRRVLFHCIALKNPLPELVRVIEALCHGGVEHVDGITSITKTGKRACLSLGAMAKSLHMLNVTESDNIVDRLETWLKLHNETESTKIIKPRKKRSIAQYDRVSRKHIETKAVLLLSLGNAGKQRSLNHIKSYLVPNTGTPVWRRSAANSLRHFNCSESATALIQTAVHDADAVVRQTATKVLENHPRRKQITQEQADIVLSKNYTYPVVARIRRDLMQILKQGINIHIELPGFEWEKTVGTSKIGASFGVHIRNILDLKLGLLEGHFMVDVFDDAHAEAHVGLLNFHVEMLKASVCFKGHIEYNLNVLKDFEINGPQDLVNIYDKIVGKIVNPIKSAVESFFNVIHLSKNGSITKIINTLVSTVKQLPHTLTEAALRLKEFVEEVFSLAGSTILEEIKHVVNHLRQFVDGIKHDILKFYHDVVDSVTMALPYTGKKITEALNLIVEGFEHLIDNPMQSISAMSKAVTTTKMAIIMVVDVKDKIVGACMFLKGRTTEWFNAAKEIPSTISRLQDVMHKLVYSVTHTLADGIENSFNNGVQSMEDAYTNLKHDLKAKWDRVLVPIKVLMNISKPFLDVYKAFMDMVKDVKFAFKKLKEVIENGNGLIQKVFGPKFHHKFPTHRRPKKGGCQDGVWPTTTNDHYQTTGVDLTLGRGQSIVAPVGGIVYVQSGNKVLIQPTDPEFAGQEIVIENIKPEGNENGKWFKSGEKIGKASSVGFCKPNFIHVSIRKSQNTAISDKDFDYTDPSSYLDRLVPEPKWIQECNDHEFRCIGQTFDFGELALDALQSASEKLKRAWDVNLGSLGAFGIGSLGDLGIGSLGDLGIGSLGDLGIGSLGDLGIGSLGDLRIDRLGDLGIGSLGDLGIGSLGDLGIGSLGDLGASLGPGDYYYRPDDESLYDSTPFGESLKKSLKTQTAAFADFFKTALFSKDGPKIPNILEIVDVNVKTVKWIFDQLDNESELFRKFNNIIGSLKHYLTDIPAGNPAVFPLSLIKRLLSFHGSSSVAGGIADLVAKLTQIAENKCPLFRGGIASGFGHMCFARCDCLGLSCNIAMQQGCKTEYLRVEMYFNIDENKLRLIFNGSVFDLIADGQEHSIVLPLTLFNLTVSLAAQLSHTDDTYTLSLEAKLCSNLLMTCLPPFQIFTEIRFPSVQPKETADCKNGGLDHTAEDAENEIHTMSIPTFINHLADCNLLNHDVTDILDNVRATVVKRLMEETVDKLGEVTKEFKDKVDFCLSSNIPVPPFDVTFFYLRYFFLIGPVPLSLGFGAGGSLGLGVKLDFCILSMTVKTTLTPWVGAMASGDAAVDIGFARGGIKLKGYLLETKFPTTLELVFSKFPLDIGSKMDLLLTPVRLELSAFAEIDLLFVTVTVFNAVLWRSKTPSIQRNILNVHKKDEDKSPPELQPQTINTRTKRNGHKGCAVQQIPERLYYDTAFKIEMHAKDPVSDVKLFYAVGTYRGGTDAIDWTEMGGPSLLLPAKLPGGIPLYWTVKARNSQGLEATAQCSLNTFDSTVPNGRVEHAYRCSSHPTKLVASVVVFDDSPLIDNHYKAVGYSAGKFGSQFVDWEDMSLSHAAKRVDISGYLQHFTVAREGKLVASVLKTQKTLTPEECARLCIQFGLNCVSFDYETNSETCDIHDVVEGANAYLKLSGTYSNYERFTSGHHAPIEYTNLKLQSGTVYFVNVHVKNILGYEAFLAGEGTMVDFTPPEPGPVGNVSKDVLKAENCTAAITQRCLDVSWKNNHRIIIDGPGAASIFNGHNPLFDELYTLTTHYISANWYGFHDDQCGIWGYTWAVGRQVCGTDIVPYTDPYSHVSSKTFWTDSAFKKGFNLADGAYYVTVQALNGAELGGSLVTTVCHSTPFTVDTTPPMFNGVTEIIYDEDFDLIAIYYSANDNLSKIAKVDFGLGKTKYDVELKAYSLHQAMSRDDPFVSLKELGLKEGIPAWIRIRVTNNVGLFTAGHGDEPILIDKSPPIVGTVLDGDKLHKDIRYQSDNQRICAQWLDFYDPESGIDRFHWGVGTKAGLDNVVKFRNLTQYEKSACATAELDQNTTYYSTVFAFNNALNSKDTNGSSDGVLVDTTPPLAGSVSDGGDSDPEEMQYSSETVTKTCHWIGYQDPESGIDKYKVDVYINTELKKSFEVRTDHNFQDKTISLEHNDRVYFSVHGINGAGLEITSDSNGFLVDHTLPIMTKLSDTENDTPYQREKTSMHIGWNFKDDESGIKEYRTVIYETKEGIKQHFWPKDAAFNLSEPMSEFSGDMNIVLGNLSLSDGGKYSVHVTSVNGALLSTAHESEGVVVDSTPPKAPKVHIGLWDEEENVNDDGQVLHDDQKSIRVSWRGRDSESGIVHYFVAIGVQQDNEKVYPFTSYSIETSALIQNIHFDLTEESNISYIVAVRAENGAGLLSDIGYSRPIYVQKANIPGIVFDGRTLYHDSQYTNDHTSLAASFYGFESESCNIIGYEWAIGTLAFATDVLPYTNYGIVLQNHTHGYMQINSEFNENMKYFVTVRAVTGCRGQFIISSSDGILMDSVAPYISFDESDENDTTLVFYGGVWYQDNTDSINIKANATDEHYIESVKWALGSLPLWADLKNYTSDYSDLSNVVSLNSGDTTFISGRAEDEAGNFATFYSHPILVDSSPPVIHGLKCTNIISYRQALATCSWEKIIEYESLVTRILISIGTASQLGNILFEYNQPLTKQYFKTDFRKYILEHRNNSSFYIGFTIINVVGRRNDYERKVSIDHSPPIIAGVHVVTRTNDKNEFIALRCQIPTSYVEIRVDAVQDMESEIDEASFKVAFGTMGYATDIQGYHSIRRNDQGIFFVDGLNLLPGSIFHATIRCYNKVGLYTDATSSQVVVSQLPYVEVLDGPGEYDIDFQSVPNIIQGHWKYSDACPITSAKWKVTNLLGDIIENFRSIPDSAERFYNDEVKLQVGVKYFVTVETFDALNRTKIASSDGVTVRIQPPYPGKVRDGKDKDLNYQFSTEELSANWDPFGDSSNDPTQFINHYEVAIGNDRRYANTRSNVHYFQNVGLNTSYTFYHLNLTAKSVRYYVTVRSYSITGGLAEGYSNGIQVGYKGEIVQGYVDTKPFQTSSETLAISWGGFQSDIGIMQYMVALSSQEYDFLNSTVECSQIDSNKTKFDASQLHGVGLDEFVELNHLSLSHGRSYYPTVIAEDRSGMCTAVSGSAITVDATPPLSGDIFINGLQSKTPVFAKSANEMLVEWESFADPESGILSSKVTLLDCNACDKVRVSTCIAIAETDAQSENKTNFYELDLVPSRSYKINIVTTNGAGLSVEANSSVVLLDTSSPAAGVVKITDDWSNLKNFQFEKDEIHGKLAIALSKKAYICSSQMHWFPTSAYMKWNHIDDEFSNDYSVVNTSGAFLGIGYNGDFTEITKSGIISESMYIRDGNYSFSIRAGFGLNIITTVAFVNGSNAIHFKLGVKPSVDVFDYARFENLTGLSAQDNDSFSASNNETTTVSPQAGEFKIHNTTNSSNTTTLGDNDFGYGIHILGYKIGNNDVYHGMLWAQNQFASVTRWFQFDFDPTKREHYYSIGVAQQLIYQQSTTTLMLFIDGHEVMNIKGLELGMNAKLALLIWNEDNYKPPIKDLFHPFYTKSIIRQINIPKKNVTACLNGKPFFDGESGIKEIWAGISDSETMSDNIEPFHLLHKFCYPCNDSCQILCREDCNATRLNNDYTVIDLNIDNLNLQEVELGNGCLNVTNEKVCNSTSYYLTTKLVNFAGQSTLVHSNAIQIDVTPPVCEYIHCLNPEYSTDEPTSYLGSSSTIGAYWKCVEDVSLIDHYEMHVTTRYSNEVLMKNRDLRTQLKAIFELGNDTFKDKHDYMVHITAFNTAGLTYVHNCTVHVKLYPPNVNATDTQSIFANASVTAEGLASTDSQNRIGIKWSGGEDEIRFYEWKLGSGADGDDILPPLIVGANHTGTAAIEHGKLVLNEIPTNKTIAEFYKKENTSVLNFTQNSERENAFFYLEPGRCVYQTLTAIGWSYLKSKMKSKTVCITRAVDVEVTRTITNQSEIISKSRLSETWTHGMPLSSDAQELILEADIIEGRLTVGSLNQDDKTAVYGCAATSKFKSYISDPIITGYKTSRILRNRISKYCNVSFYIAPSPVVHYSVITINITLPDACKSDTDYQPALIYWNPETDQWHHTDEGCFPYLTARGTNEIYTSNVCTSATNNTNHGQRRAASYIYLQPRAFELAVIERTFPNNPPNITTTALSCLEDSPLIAFIDTFDLENDTLIYEIISIPQHATCEINTNGLLNCTLEEDFYGNDELTIKVTETDLPLYERPYSHEKSISLIVRAVPDKTDRFFIDTMGQVHSDKRPFLKINVHTNANDSTIFDAGTIILADVDGSEEFDYDRFSTFTPLNNSIYIITELESADILNRNMLSSSYRTIKAYSVKFWFSNEISGQMTLNFIAVNNDSAYTPSVTIDLYILKNPCVHGSCSHRVTGPSGCDDLSRASTFDPFICVCAPGYTDQWCQTNINECASEPCTMMFDCEDLVNDYSCNINVPKLMAILLCSPVAIAGIIVLIHRYFRKFNDNYTISRQSNASRIGSDLQSIRGSSRRSSFSIFLEHVRSSILPQRYTGHRLSETLGTYKLKNPNLQVVSSNKTDGGSKARIELSSRAFLHLGEVGPLYNREPTFELEMITLGQRPAGSPGSEESLTGSMAQEDTLIDGIMIEESVPSIDQQTNEDIGRDNNHSRIQQMEELGQHLSKDFKIFEANAPEFHDVSSNETDDGSNAELRNPCSRAFFGVEEVRPLYPESNQTTQKVHKDQQEEFHSTRNEGILEHEIVTVAEISAGSPESGQNLTGSMAHEDTMMAGIIIEEKPERPESRMSNIDI